LFEIQPEDLVKTENIIVNQNQQGGNGAFIINQQLSEKLIEQYEQRLKDKDEIISVASTVKKIVLYLCKCYK